MCEHVCMGSWRARVIVNPCVSRVVSALIFLTHATGAADAPAGAAAAEAARSLVPGGRHGPGARGEQIRQIEGEA